MPAQISHYLAARSAAEQCNSPIIKNLVQAFPQWFYLGAQGPDIFLHNHMTMPSGVRLGRYLHHGNYGNFCAGCLRSGLKQEEPASAWLAGFLTHAPLDRHTHPYIHNKSGWVLREKPETEKYRMCHAFMERIIDLLMYRRYKSEKPDWNLPPFYEFDFLSRVKVHLPASERLESIVAASLTELYSHIEQPGLRFQNALRDAMYVFGNTNPGSIDNMIAMYKRESEENRGRRMLAIFHPLELPETTDFLNLQHNVWRHPCSGDEYRDTIPGMFDSAIQKGAKYLSLYADILESNRPAEDLRNAVGNHNLEDGTLKRFPGRFRYMDPLNLPEILNDFYRKVGERAEES